MRVLVSAVGTRGDVQPAIALAIALRARGHDVRLAVPPNFVAWAASLGFEASPLGIEMRAPRAGAAPTAEQMRALASDLITGQFEAIGAAAEGCDAIVGAGAHQYAVRSIAELRGIPSYVAVYAPVSLPSTDLAPVAAPGEPWDPSANVATRWQESLAAWNARSLERVNQNRARLGLSPIADVLRHILGDSCWLAADSALGPAPTTPGMRVVGTGAWILEDEAPLPDALEAFLGAGDPPIYVGLGSMPAAKETSRALIEAVRAAGRRVILSQGWAELELVDDAADAIAIGDVDHRALFSRLAAVVHHGGAGTTTTAARAGVPQVVTPMFGDQFYWGMRVEQLGLGRCTPLASLSGALRASLAPDVAERARALAGEIRSDGAEIAAALVG